MWKTDSQWTRHYAYILLFVSVFAVDSSLLIKHQVLQVWKQVLISWIYQWPPSPFRCEAVPLHVSFSFFLPFFFSPEFIVSWRATVMYSNPLFGYFLWILFLVFPNTCGVTVVSFEGWIAHLTFCLCWVSANFFSFIVIWVMWPN